MLWPTGAPPSPRRAGSVDASRWALHSALASWAPENFLEYLGRLDRGMFHRASGALPLVSRRVRRLVAVTASFTPALISRWLRHAAGKGSLTRITRAESSRAGLRSENGLELLLALLSGEIRVEGIRHPRTHPAANPNRDGASKPDNQGEGLHEPRSWPIIMAVLRRVRAEEHSISAASLSLHDVRLPRHRRYRSRLRGKLRR